MNYSSKINKIMKVPFNTAFWIYSIIIMLCIYSNTAFGAYTVDGTTLTAETVTEAKNDVTAEIKATITKLIITGNIEGTSTANNAAGDWSQLRGLRGEGYNILNDIELLTEQTMPNGTGNFSFAYGLFHGCTWIESFSAPNMTSVGGYAFYGCTQLKTINFPKVNTIGAFAFHGCTSLTTFTFPAIEGNIGSTDNIGNSAFMGCNGLTVIDESMFPNITALGGAATTTNYKFRNCANLTSVSFPKVTKTGIWLFDGCAKLETLKFPALTEIITNAFGHIYGLKEIKDDFFPNVTIIRKDAFYPNNTAANNNLRAISFPKVTQLDPSAFGNATANRGHIKLEKVSFPALTTLESGTFQNSTLLANIDASSFPALTTLAANAFLDCNGLKSVNLPAVETVDATAFTNCPSLESVVLSAVTSIAPRTFTDTLTKLTTVELPLIKVVPEEAFLDCVSLTTVKMPAVETIDISAFSGCSALSTDINETNFPNLTAINSLAFFNCANIKTIEHTKITNIYDGAFSNCSSLETISLPLTSVSISAFAGCTNLTTIDLPEVTIIMSNAFSNCRALQQTALNFPKVTTIEVNAFDNCHGLTALAQSNFPLLTAIDGFSNCVYLREVDFPNVTTIKPMAFAGCIALRNFNLPAVTTIEGLANNFPNGAFSGCMELRTLSDANFPNLTSIGANAFYDCAALISVNFSNVTNISSAAFGRCTNLSSLTFPALESIEEAIAVNQGAFNGCNSLTSIVIPSVKTINGFSGCANLKEVYFQSATHVGSNAFAASSNLISIGLGAEVKSVTQMQNSSTAFDGLTTENIDLFVGANLRPQPLTTNKTWEGHTWKSTIIENGIAQTELTFVRITDAVNFLGNRNAVRKITITGQISGTNYSSTSEWSKFSALNPAYPVLEEIIILTSQAIPDGNATDAGNANCLFAGTNTWLKRFSAPNVTKIGNYAFTACNALTSLTFGTGFAEPATIAVDENNTFFQTNTGNIDLTLSQNALPIPSFVTNTWQGYQWKSIAVGNVPTELTFETVTEALNYTEYIAAVKKLTITGTIDGNDYSQNSEWSKFKTMNEKYPALSDIVILTEQAIPDRDSSIVDGKNLIVSLFNSYDGTTTTYNNWLQSFSAPNATSVGSYAFYQCSNLTNVSMPSATAIHSMAFSHCNKLASIPEMVFAKLAVVGDWSFANCIALKDIHFPMVFEVQANAFAQCTELETITLPKVTNIEFSAFFECDNVNNVTFGTDFMQPKEIYLDAATGIETFAAQTDLTLGQYVLPAPLPLNDVVDDDVEPALRMWTGHIWNSITVADAPDYLYTVVLQTAPANAGITVLANAGNRDLVSIRAIPVNDCYHFTGWADSRGIISEDNPMEISLTRDTTLTAQFSRDITEIQINTSVGGTVNPSGTITIPCGDSLIITATADADYIFSSWTNRLTGRIISNKATDTLTLEQYTANPSILANFTKEPIKEYTVTLLSNPTDAGTLTGAGMYNENTEVTINATAKAGYTFDNWTDASNAVVSEDTTYTFTITNNITLTANFTPITTDLLPEITTQPLSQDVVSGATFTLSVIATGDNLIYQWKKDGTDLTGATTDTYTKTNATTADSGKYVCVVSNSAGNVTSDTATINIVNSIEEYIDGFSLTPNPTSDVITLNMNILQSGNINVSLVNLNGVELVTFYNSFAEVGHFTKSFSLKQFPTSVYYIKVVHNGNVKLEKVIRN